MNIEKVYNQEMQWQKKTKLSDLEFLFFIFVIAYYVLPAIGASIPFVLSLGVCVGYAAFLWLLKKREGNYALFLIVAALGVSFLYLMLTDSATISQTASNYLLKRILSKFNQVFMTFFPAIVFLRVKRFASEKQKKLLFGFVILMFGYVLLNTTLELIRNGGAARDWENFDEQTENNVGTYAFVYAVPLLIAFLPVYFSNDKKIGSTIVLFSVIAFLFLFLLLAQYTLALLIALIGLSLQIGNKIKKNSTKLIMLFCLLLVVLLIPTMLNFLADHIQSRDMSIRLRELANFFGSGSSGGYNLSGRLSLYWQTILAFIKSPILGNRSLIFDGHATFLTVFADIGILGGGLFVYLYHYTKKKMFLGEKRETRKIFSTVFTCLVLMGLTNPIHSAFTLAFTMWFFVPMLLDRKIEKEKKDEATLGN